MHLPWGRKAVRIAISIGQDADDTVLAEFTGNKELVLQANNAAMLTKMIKWASTAASMVSAPASRVAAENPIAVPAPASAPQPVDAGGNDPLIPAGNGNGPLVLDMNNIPDPDGGDVW